MLSWIAEGSRESQDPVVFHAKQGKGHYNILKMLGQTIDEQPSRPAAEISEGYALEIKEGGSRPRLDMYRELLGVEALQKRPTFSIPDDAMKWAEEVKRDVGDRRIVLLFPHMGWASRAWPTYYWVDLSWQLNERGLAAIGMMPGEDKKFANIPRRYWGFDLTRIVALMSISSLVVGNDSGPAHLSGTLGVPTIVLAGPTRADCVFKHIPNVIVLTSNEEPHCAGCHFKPPYRAACDQGCQSLATLKPHVVLRRAIWELALASSRPPRTAGVERAL